jgi:hypothetical protein
MRLTEVSQLDFWLAVELESSAQTYLFAADVLCFLGLSSMMIRLICLLV